MGLFNFIETVSDSINDAARRVNNFTSGIRNVARGAQQFIDVVRDPAKLISNIRSSSIPPGAVPQKKTYTKGKFVKADNQNGEDWRVRLHLPAQPSTFSTSPILQPLVKSNNSMVWPVTPQIVVSHTANYNMFDPIHTNYPYPVYENSRVEDITISGDFPVENEADGRYWIAAVHFCRSITKMFYGQGDLRGHPPPRVALSGYGDFIFDETPVIVKMFSIDLPNNVDYIRVPIDPQDFKSEYPDKAINGTTYTYVPTLSTINITVAPAYSRDATRQFDLNTFINGGYIGQKTPGGFI